MAKRRNTDPDLATAKHAGVCLSSFKTEKCFVHFYPDVTVSREQYYLPPGDTVENLKWIKYFGPRLVTTFSTIIMRNESSLYPLIFDILSPLVHMHSEFSISSFTILDVGDMIPEDLSFTPATTSVTPENFRIYLEENIKTEKVRGNVEFIIKSSGKIRAVVEAKQIIKSLEFKDESGFWQLCAEMMVSQGVNGDPSIPILGIFTDGFRFFFLRLEHTEIRVSKLMNPFSYDEYFRCLPTATEIVPYLLQVFSASSASKSQDFDRLLKSSITNTDFLLSKFLDAFNAVLEAEERGKAEGKAEGMAEAMSTVISNAKRNGLDKEVARQLAAGMSEEVFQELWTREE
jgi:hypothetical protein